MQIVHELLPSVGLHAAFTTIAHVSANGTLLADCRTQRSYVRVVHCKERLPLHMHTHPLHTRARWSRAGRAAPRGNVQFRSNFCRNGQYHGSKGDSVRQPWTPSADLLARRRHAPPARAALVSVVAVPGQARFENSDTVRAHCTPRIVLPPH